MDIIGLMASLGWSQASLGRRVGVHAETVANWVHGRSRVPKAVLLYMTVLVRLKEIGDE